MEEKDRAIIHIGGSTSLLLALVFFFSKVFGLISWSWWLVFLPLLWPLYLIGAILVIIAGVLGFIIVLNVVFLLCCTIKDKILCCIVKRKTKQAQVDFFKSPKSIIPPPAPKKIISSNTLVIETFPTKALPEPKAEIPKEKEVKKDKSILDEIIEEAREEYIPPASDI